MTVEELIEELKKYPPNENVYCEHSMMNAYQYMSSRFIADRIVTIDGNITITAAYYSPNSR